MENDNGKTEMWYIVDAAEGSGIYCGFKIDTTKEEFLSRVKDGTVEELLNFIPVRKGDCFLIEEGTVHAIGADGKLRQLHIDKAVEVLNFNKFKNNTNSGVSTNVEGGTIQTLTECAYFYCRKLVVKSVFTEIVENSFTTVNVLDGRGTINGVPFVAGDSFFIGCGEKLIISGKAEVILTNKSNNK